MCYLHRAGLVLARGLAMITGDHAVVLFLLLSLVRLVVVVVVVVVVVA